MAKPKRDERGCFIKGAVPANKIILNKQMLQNLYKVYGSVMIARKLKVSQQIVLRCLHEYKIPIKPSPEKLPAYHIAALHVSKTKPAWNKGKTKKTNATLLQMSKKLEGSNNKAWKAELHTDEKILCKCGCGEVIDKYDKKGRLRYYKKGHCNAGWFTTENISGENNYAWKGGVSSKEETVRASKQYKQWRLSVYKRDHYICQSCGSKKEIIAHHIKYFNAYPELRFNIDNGITLCRSCHLKLHQKEKENAK